MNKRVIGFLSILSFSITLASSNTGLAADVPATQSKAISEFAKYPIKKMNSGGIQYHFGPNLDKNFKVFLQYNVESTLNLFSDFYDKREKFHVFAGSEKDLDWIIKEWHPYNFDTSYTIAEYKGRIASEGKNVNAGTVPSLPMKESHLSIIRGSGLASKKNFAMLFVPHETIHIVQQHLTDSHTDKLPCWAREGGADFFGIAAGLRINKSNYENWKKSEMYAYKSGNSGVDVKKFTANQWFTQLKSLEGNFSGGCDYAKKFAYGPGMLMSELQVAQKGVPGITKWWSSLKDGEDWKVSFEKIYGKNIDSWYKTDAIPYIISEYKRL
jgi:hypothetical protein